VTLLIARDYSVVAKSREDFLQSFLLLVSHLLFGPSYPVERTGSALEDRATWAAEQAPD
jgi:hypothetical protein